MRKLMMDIVQQRDAAAEIRILVSHVSSIPWW
jgi:hypothetical protein